MSLPRSSAGPTGDILLLRALFFGVRPDSCIASGGQKKAGQKPGCESF